MKRLGATRDKILKIAERTQGKDAERLKALVQTMCEIANRWADIYNNERTRASDRIKELEGELEDE